MEPPKPPDGHKPENCINRPFIQALVVKYIAFTTVRAKIIGGPMDVFVLIRSYSVPSRPGGVL